MRAQIVKSQKKISLSILLVFLFLTCFLSETAWSETYQFVLSWGSSGTGNGQFDTPFGVAVDTSDDVFVAEVYNNRIQKFSSNGTYLTQWGSMELRMNSLTTLDLME